MARKTKKTNTNQLNKNLKTSTKTNNANSEKIKCFNIDENASYFSKPSLFEKYNINITNIEDENIASVKSSNVFKKITYDNNNNNNNSEININQNNFSSKNTLQYSYRNSNLFNDLELLNKKLILDFVEENSSNVINNSNLLEGNYNFDSVKLNYLDSNNVNITDIDINDLEVNEISIQYSPTNNLSNDSIEIGNIDLNNFFYHKTNTDTNSKPSTKNPSYLEFLNAIDILSNTIKNLKSNN